MTWPSSDVGRTNADATGDNPQLFRADALDLIDKFNLLRNHVSAFVQGLLAAANAAAARVTLGAAASGSNGDITDLSALTAINGGPVAGLRNVLINGGFTVNQRVYLSAATLAAGAFGHDRWKAGAGGGNYSFTLLASDTTITIGANKTLIQVVEDKNVQATSYVLSWTGTAQARVGVNSATPSGAYASSPILITGQTVGTTMSVEFGNGASAGTLGKVQLERASASAQATLFEQRPYGLELSMCQRYLPAFAVGTGILGNGAINSTSQGLIYADLPVEARVPPSSLTATTPGNFQLSVAGVVNSAATIIGFGSTNTRRVQLVVTGTGAPYTIGQAAYVYGTSASCLVLLNGCEL